MKPLAELIADDVIRVLESEYDEGADVYYITRENLRTFIRRGVDEITRANTAMPHPLTTVVTIGELTIENQELSAHNSDLAAKLQFLLNYVDHHIQELPEGFTFPDGDHWFPDPMVNFVTEITTPDTEPQQ
jgi:hypothetical protein